MVGRTLMNEETISRTGYDPVKQAASDVAEEVPKIEPLPQFSVGVPAGWKDALYDEPEPCAEAHGYWARTPKTTPSAHSEPFVIGLSPAKRWVRGVHAQ